MNQSRPRIGHVIDSVGLSGGTEKNLAANLREFDHTAMRHEVVALRPDPDNRLTEIPEEVDVRFLFDEDEPITRTSALRRLLALTKVEEYDLIHASLPFSAFASRVVGLRRPPLVVESLVNISHEPVRCIDNPAVTRPKLRYHTLLDRATMRGVDAFHAVSQEVAESWARVVGISPDKVEVIPRGVDVAAIPQHALIPPEQRNSLRSELGVPEEAFMLVSAGRHEAQKGHRYFIEAAIDARDAVPNLHAVVVGREGHLTPMLRDLIQREDASAFVHLTGSRRDVHQVMAAADVFVFPSLFEGNGGNALLEAMAVGLPIITTGVAPMTDLIPDEAHGVLCPRADAACIARGIRTLAADQELREKLGIAARQRVLGFADSVEIARRFEDLYARLIG